MGWGADSDGVGFCGENQCWHNTVVVDSHGAGASGGILGVIQR